MDDFFDDLGLEDYAVIGGFFGFVEDEEEAECRRKRLEEEMLDLDNLERDLEDDDDEDHF